MKMGQWPVETIPEMEERGQRRMMEGVNLTKIHCKHFCKCHSVPQYNKMMIKFLEEPMRNDQ
jgi:hypothetical protein